MENWYFRLTKFVGVQAESEFQARGHLEEAIEDADWETFHGPDDPEYVGPLPSNTIQTIDGASIYTFAGPRFIFVFTEAADKMIAGPPPLDPNPQTRRVIRDDHAPFEVPCYAAIFKVYRVPAAGQPHTYYVFLSLIFQGGRVVPGTGWAEDATLGAFYDRKQGLVNPGFFENVTGANWQ